MMMIKAESPAADTNLASGGGEATSPSSSALKRKNHDQEGVVGEPRTKSTLHHEISSKCTVVASSSRAVVNVDESSVSSTDTVGVTTRSKRSLKIGGNGSKKSPAASDDEEEKPGELKSTVSKNSKRKAVKGRLCSKITSRSGLRHMAQRSRDHAIRTKLKTTISPPCLKTRLQKSRASLQQTTVVSSSRLRDLSTVLASDSKLSLALTTRFSDKPIDSTLKAEPLPVVVRSTSVTSLVTAYVNDEATENWLDTFREWNVKNKLQALEQILEMCDYAHIKHVHNFIEPKLQRDYISELPRELILLMLTYVRPKDLNKLAQVSHYWNDIANDSILWKNICRKCKITVRDDDQEDGEASTALVMTTATIRDVADQPCTSSGSASNSLSAASSAAGTTTTAASCCSPSSPSSSSSEQSSSAGTTEIATAPVTVAVALQTAKSTKTRKQSTSQSGNPLKGSTNARQALEITKMKLAPSKAPSTAAALNENPRFNFLKSFNQFKRAYLVDYNVTRNWCSRPLPKQIALKSHDDHVITCLKFDGLRVISGSDDCTLRVWCALTGTLLHTLSGHTGGVWASQLKDNIVISGSTDRSVRVWNIDTGECIHVLTGHTSTVRCLALHGNLVVSGSRDSLLRIWNIETGQCLQVLRGHAAAVRCVCFDGNYVVSGSYDYTIRVWDPATGQCKHVLEGHANRVYSLLFDGERIVSGSLDTTIIVWNVQTGAVIHRLMGHHSLTSGMQIKGDILVSGNADSTVKIWSLKTGECLHTLGGCNRHMSAVTCMSFNEKFVVSSSDDGTVKLWDLNTGEFIRNLLALDSGGRGGVVWRISMHKNKLVCAVGSRIGVEETKLILLDFDWPPNRLADRTTTSTSSAAASSVTASLLAQASTSNQTSAPVTTAVITASRLLTTSSASATSST